MILLASKSPQRTQLLKQAGLRHVTITTIDDDAAAANLPAQILAVERARRKAQGADWQSQEHYFDQSHAAVVAADTVVHLGGRVFGSPQTAEQAERMLAELSGTRHSILTAHCCWLPARNGAAEKEAIAVAVAQVTMLPMSEQDIRTYVASGESIGRAGGYAVQLQGDRFIADIQGERDTVIGLHVASVQRLYREVTGSLPKEQ